MEYIRRDVYQADEYFLYGCEIALGWMSQNIYDDKSTLFWFQTRGHYLSQCWPRPMSPYVVIMSQRVNWQKTRHTLRLLDTFVTYIMSALLN